MMDTTSLTVIQRASVALGAAEHEKKLIALAQRSKDIETITNADGYRQCHSARMVLKNERINLERLGKSAREDAQAFAKAVIKEQDRLIGLIEPEESRLQAIQAEWDAIEERKRKAEADRIAMLQQRVSAIGELPASVVGRPSGEILRCLQILEILDTADFAEFAQFAQEAKTKAIAAISQLHAGALAQEEAAAAEKAKIEAERAELAKLRAEQEERTRTEAARIAQEAQERARAESEAKDRIEAEERASKARIEAQEAESRKIIQEAERIARITREAEESKARAAQEKADAKAKAKREKEEAIEAERKRKEREATETDELLCAVLMRMDDKPHYAEIASAIVSYFETKHERIAA